MYGRRSEGPSFWKIVFGVFTGIVLSVIVLTGISMCTAYYAAQELERQAREEMAKQRREFERQQALQAIERDRQLREQRRRQAEQQARQETAQQIQEAEAQQARQRKAEAVAKAQVTCDFWVRNARGNPNDDYAKEARKIACDKLRDIQMQTNW